MADEPKDGPQNISTKQIPKVEVPGNTLDAILQEVRAARSENVARFDRIEATVDTLVEDGKSANKRMTQLEYRMDSLEDRGAKYSGGVRQLSETDAKHDAAIANIVVRVDGVEKKVDAVAAATDAQTKILERLENGAKEFVNNPKVQLLVGVMWTALLGYLASKGLVSR